MSSIPQNKDELINAITLASKKLSDEYRSIPDELSRTFSIEGNVKGTEISVSQNV